MTHGDRASRVKASLLFFGLAAMLLLPTGLSRTDAKRQAPRLCIYPLPDIFTALGVALLATSSVSFICWGQPGAGITLLGTAVAIFFLGEVITRSRLWASKWSEEPLPYLALPIWLMLLLALAGLGGVVGGSIAAFSAEEWAGGIAAGTIGLLLLVGLWAALSFRGFTARIGQPAPAGFPFPALDGKCQAAAVTLGALGLLAWIWSEPWAIAAGTALAVLGLLIAWFGRTMNRVAAEAPETQLCAAVDGIGIAEKFGKLLVISLLFWVVFWIWCGDDDEQEIGDPPPPTLETSSETTTPPVVELTTTVASAAPTDPTPPTAAVTTTTTEAVVVSAEVAECSSLIGMTAEEFLEVLLEFDGDVPQIQSGPTALPDDPLLRPLRGAVVPVTIEDRLPVVGDNGPGIHTLAIMQVERAAGTPLTRYQFGVIASTDPEIKDPEPGGDDALARIPAATKAWFWDVAEESLTAFELPGFVPFDTAAFAHRCGEFILFGIPADEISEPWLWFQSFGRSTPQGQAPAIEDPAGYSVTPALPTR